MAERKIRQRAGMNLAFAIVGVLAIAIGIYLVFFHSKGFIETEATIVSIETIESDVDGEEEEHIVIVRYEVDGTAYEEELDDYSPTYHEGKTVKVYYDPKNPSTIHGGNGLGIYFLIIGVLMLGGAIYLYLKERKGLQEQIEKYGETTYLPSVKGEERELYFLTDLGTPKYGHRIEDADGKVLYEAKMTKFTLGSPYGFDFIDHVNGETKPHLVGHEEAAENNTWLIDNHYTFSFDGEDVWKHLKRHGIRVLTRFEEGKPLWIHYTVYRDEEIIAEAESSSRHVHEKDEESAGKLASMIPARGFFRIYTAEENLDLLFLTMMAFARTQANDARGGNYGLLLGKKS